MLSEKNSKNGILGASINDISLEAHSENLEKTMVNLGSITSSPKQSKLPIYKNIK